MTISSRSALRLPSLLGSLGMIALVVLPATGARAATTATTPTTAPAANAAVQNFCSQVRNSQTSIASATGTTADKNRRIGQEWAKIERVAPAAVKAQVTLIKAAYTKAAGQSDAAASTTLAGISAAGQKVTNFVTSNCSGNGAGGRGDGPDGDGPGRMTAAQLATIQACFKKEGVTFPTPGQGGQGAQGAQGQRPNFDDPKFQAAAQKCGFGGGGRGGFGGGRGLSDAVRACLAKKGVTLPSFPGRNGTGANGGNGANGGTPPSTPTTKAGAAATGNGNGARGQLDDKTRAAIQACQAANPSTNG